MSRWITEEDIENLAVGAALLGTGGGGDPYLGKLMVQKCIRENGPIELIDPNQLSDQDTVIPVSMMGAPTIMTEKIPNGDESLKSLRLMEKQSGVKANATMPVECGGLNSTIPFVVASKAGIPVVDADGMGRAFPELQMETFHIHGVSASPTALHDERGNAVFLEAQDSPMIEHIARGVAVRMGGVAHAAMYKMTGKEVKDTSIHNTMSLCIDLGKAIRETQITKQNPIEVIKHVTKNSIYGEAIVLFEGKVTDVERKSTDGFVRGKATVSGLKSFIGKTLQVDFQNENLCAQIDGKVVAMVPDLITFLDSETGLPITTEGMKYGFRVICIGIPTPPIMRSDKAIEVWGPRYFGYDMDYVEIEKIHDKEESHV
ncbi:DUF917 family protein [Terrilactibacillus sp. BCM23-1]|uniref:DUF917 family protein n=1 Tax=Terrilactibacillus tamarindi TaxID=2599694 RepID=A0A6N8CT12_9BACI|nr:DUF917 domain-containing protein [Terrilactibacillus tamarindi]MTT32193.1 DUF917 family protein [Terrilactibacillus tamarindi]